ncbi:MGMT family protein [Niallia sp. 01092]|uniref:MGMT family protein n=1 Tax=unclassified Niallia TaxID=2837522 RepID=UPI003FD2864E
MKSFTSNVIRVIQSIPAGKVMTYGQIAKIAGSSRGARQVVRILHAMSSKYELPWHRVINASGKISIQNEEAKMLQKQLLEEEGIVFEKNEQISLQTYIYDPVELMEESQLHNDPN